MNIQINAKNAGPITQLFIQDPSFWRHGNLKPFPTLVALKKAIWGDMVDEELGELKKVEFGANIYNLAWPCVQELEAQSDWSCTRPNLMARMCKEKWFNSLVINEIRKG